MSTKNVRLGGNRIQIRKFEMDKMCEYATIGLIAKRASGKSWITRDLLYTKRDIPVIQIISKTEKLNHFYSDYVKDSFIFDEFSHGILHCLFERQTLISEENKLREKIGKSPKDDRTLLIMDDCMSSNGKWMSDESIRDLFFNGRHYHISFVLTLQYVKGIPPDLRSNFDYIFLLAEDFTNNRRKLYDEYAGMFPTFDVFCQIFTQLTQDYGCMVIDNRIHTTVIEDKVFWYKSKECKQFKVGCKKYKKFHDKKYDPKWDKKLPVFDTQNLAKKRNFCSVVVERVT
jgi:hypothetical protein